MLDLEDEIDQLEREFPAMADEAFAKARAQAFAAGLSVLQAENGFVVRVYPDGRKEKVKEIEPPRQLRRGMIFHLSAPVMEDAVAYNSK
ncbi:MAG TPA: hypothetical protein VGE39_25030 [Prosthecobacter sp.]